MPRWKPRKFTTDTSIQKLKEDLSNVLSGDTDSLKRIREYTLRRKQEVKLDDKGGKSNEYLQDAEFIHQILVECDKISPPMDVFKRDTKLCKKSNGKGELSQLKRGNDNTITKAERNEMYMLSVIAYDLISLEEAQKSPVHMSKAAPGFKDSLSHMQQILRLSDSTEKELADKAHKTADYSFNIKLIINGVQGLEEPSEDLAQSTYLSCKVGCLSKTMIEQKKLDLKSKGIHVNTTRFVQETGNTEWNEEFHFPLGCKEDYLLVEVWRSKTPKGGKKKSNKSAEENVSRCLLKLDPTMAETVEEDYELMTTAGKGTPAAVIMSLKIIANTTELRFISQYDASQKFAIYQKLVFEITRYLDQRGDSLCFGKLTEPFHCIQCKLIEILRLTEFQVRAAAFDCSEIWGKSKTMDREYMETSLELLKNEWDKVDNTIITTSQKRNITSNIMTVLDNELEKLANILPDFPPNELESKSRVQTMMITIIGSYIFLLDRGEKSRRFNLKDEVSQVITEGINTWYTEKSHTILDRSSPKFYLETLITLVDCVVFLMEASEMNYKEAFLAVKIDYSYVIIANVDAKIADEIAQASKIVLKEDKQEMNKLFFMMFHLYRKLHLILKRVSDSSISKKKLDELKLIKLEDWFRPFLDHWCVVLQEVCMQSIQTMIDIEEEGTHEYQGSKVSSSAIDIGVCLLPSYLMFTKLRVWSNRRERFHLALQTIQLNIDALRQYSNSMKDKIMNILENSQSDPFQVDAELCILLNNNNCMRYYVEEAKGKINLDKLNLEGAYQLTSVDELFKASIEHVDAINWKSINAIGKKFKSQFATNYAKFISSSQASDEINQDIDDLMNWLLQNVIAIVHHLSSDLFLPLLEELWMQTLECIYDYKYANKSQSTSEKIHMSLDYLRNFFQNEGQGITDEKIGETIFASLVEHFSLYGEESHELMVKFGSEISEFCKRAPDNIGSCTINVAYFTDKQELEIRVIQIENIPNPGVPIMIFLEAIVLPKYDSTPIEGKTKPRKYEKSIVFDESLNLSVPTESINRGFVLQINIFYSNTYKMGLFPDYGGSVYLTSQEIGRTNSTDSVTAVLKGANEVRKNIKMSFLADPGKCEILNILKERKSEGPVTSSFVDSVTQGVKDEKIKRIFSEGMVETKKFFNRFIK